jgi:hypothetical protein
MPKRIIHFEDKCKSHSFSCRDDLWQEFCRGCADFEKATSSFVLRRFLASYIKTWRDSRK